MNLNLILRLLLIVLVVYYVMMAFDLLPRTRTMTMSAMEYAQNEGKDVVNDGMDAVNDGVDAVNNMLNDSYSTHLTREVGYRASHDEQTNQPRGIDRSEDVDKMYELSDEVPYAQYSQYDNTTNEEYNDSYDMYDYVMANNENMIEGFEHTGYGCCNGADLNSGTFVNPHNRSKCGRPVDDNPSKISASEYCHMMCIQDPDKNNREECYEVCMDRHNSGC